MVLLCDRNNGILKEKEKNPCSILSLVVFQFSMPAFT